MLNFFAADTLFVLSYVLVFAGVYTLIEPRGPVLARVALAAGLLGGLCDALENGFFVTCTRSNRCSTDATAPTLPLIYILANIKWGAAFLAFYAFWPLAA